MPTLLAPAKLTISLRVTGVRPDGMHLIDAEMVSVTLFDTLTIEPVADGPVRVEYEGPTAGAMAGVADGSDLVSRALALADRRAAVRVHKVIPAGAGLGGGSSDAAAVLRWAGFRDLGAAARLGADVAFCLNGGRSRVSGIGEQVEPLADRAQVFTLLTPPLHCSTPVVYRRWDEQGGPVSAHEDGNDLEAAALSAYPELVRWRDELADATGLAPRLAGSGSTWFVEGAVPGGNRQVVHAIGADTPMPDLGRV